MSNKPKNTKRLVKYNKTAGEIHHEGLVKQASTYANRRNYMNYHQGSKPHTQLRNLKEVY